MRGPTGPRDDGDAMRCDAMIATVTRRETWTREMSTAAARALAAVVDAEHAGASKRARVDGDDGCRAAGASRMSARVNDEVNE